MPGPFPGVDPYLEDQGRWRDLHQRLITYFCDQLSDNLPAGYVAMLEEQVYLVDPADEGRVVPDVAVVRGGDGRRAPLGNGPALEGVREGAGPAILTLATDDEWVEEKTRWIEVRELPELDLVTATEVLSPTNKRGGGLGRYLEKRNDLIERPVNLVEIDLLSGGKRLRTREPLPAGDYYAFVSRADRRPECEVYAWSVRDPLPKVPVPLRRPDADVWLDLASAYATAYDRGRYGLLVKYDRPLSVPLSPEDREWAESLGRV